MENTFCKYKNIFGEPGTGAHSYRFFGIAIVDAGLTILLAIAIAWTFKWNIWMVLFFVFLSGILMHRLFCVDTTVGKFIFGRL